MESLLTQPPVKVVRGLLRRLVHSAHAVIARSVIVSWVYLSACGLLMRMLDIRSPFLYDVYFAKKPWRVERLRPVQRVLAGTGRRLTLVPHPGMIDFRALFVREFPYEPEVVRFLEGFLPGIDRVIEIGANVGIYTSYFSRCFAERGHGRIYAFEPSPRTFRALLDNLIANDADNVTPVNAAVSTAAGIATFFEPTVAAYGDRSLTRSSLIRQHAAWHAQSAVREYPVLTVGPEHIEALLKEPGRVLIKLDIEGAEEFVLRAIEPLLARYRPSIVMEALYHDCQTLNRLEFLLRDYRLLHLTERGPVEHDRFMGDPDYFCKDYYLQPREKG